MSGKVTHNERRTIIRDVQPSWDAALEIAGADGEIVRIVLLAEADSLALWKGAWQDRECVFLTQAGLVLNGDHLQLTSTNRADLSVGICPALETVIVAGKAVRSKPDGVFQRFTPAAPRAVAIKATCESIQPAGPARVIPLGKIRQPVAAGPEDADFEKAAVWRIKLPPATDLSTDPILRLDYAGDVARVTLDGRLICDDFYNGNIFEIGLRRHGPEILKGDLRVAILPLGNNAPIYMAKEARPNFRNAAGVVTLRSVEVVPRYSLVLQLPIETVPQPKREVGENAGER